MLLFTENTMVSTTTGQINLTDNLDAVFSSSSCNTFNASKKATATHDFTSHQCGIDYYFEYSSLNAKACMTGQGKGIKPNDYILLQLNSTLQRYQIEIIDYYSQPSNVWIALLKAMTCYE